MNDYTGLLVWINVIIIDVLINWLLLEQQRNGDTVHTVEGPKCEINNRSENVVHRWNRISDVLAQVNLKCLLVRMKNADPKVQSYPLPFSLVDRFVFFVDDVSFVICHFASLRFLRYTNLMCHHTWTCTANSFVSLYKCRFGFYTMKLYKPSKWSISTSHAN